MRVGRGQGRLDDRIARNHLLRRIYTTGDVILSFLG